MSRGQMVQVSPQVGTREARDGWQARGVCSQLGRDGKTLHDSELWFDRPEPLGYDGLTRAQLLCVECPVRRECFDAAMTTPIEQYGIWGGILFAGANRRARQRNAAFKNLPARIRRYKVWLELNEEEHKARQRRLKNGDRANVRTEYWRLYAQAKRRRKARENRAAELAPLAESQREQLDAIVAARMGGAA